jgi:hypothetical protein
VLGSEYCSLLPYKKIIRKLLEGEKKLTEIAQQFGNYYVLLFHQDEIINRRAVL